MSEPAGEDVLAVVYDRGAASPAEIRTGLADLGTVVFLVPRSAHNERLRPILAELGDVVDLTGDVTEDVRRVRALAPAAVLTFSEAALPVTAVLTGALGLPGHSDGTVRLLTDKAAQRARLRKDGVDDVRSFALHTAEDWPDAVAVVGLPAIVKPAGGEGSRATHVVTEADDPIVASLFAGAPAGTTFVAEELLRGEADPLFGDYVSVESVAGRHGVTHLAVSGKFPLAPPFRETGLFWPAALPADRLEAVLDLTSRALAALEVGAGLTHTELKLTARGPRIIEVNGRLGGHVAELARNACGVDLVRLAGLVALGEHVRPRPLVPEGVHFMHYGLAPTRPCRLAGVEGEAAVRELPGVRGYRAYRRPGADLPGGVQTERIDVLWGAVADHGELVRLLRQARPLLRYDLEFPDGTRETATAGLPA